MMKKLIAVLAFLAMVTTAAFAQAAVSGTIQTRFNAFRGNFNDDYGHTFGGSFGAAHLQLSGTNETGTLGGLFRFRNLDAFGYSTGSDGGFRMHRAFVWWRPIPMFRFFLGQDPDGMFDTTQIAGWAFHQGENDYMFNHDWGFWRDIFPGNWDHFGVALSFFNLVDGLNVNLVLPTARTGTDGFRQSWLERQVTVEQMLAGFRLHSTFNLPGTGLLQFTYNAPGGRGWNTAATTWEDAPNFGQLGLSFLLNGLPVGDFLVGGSVLIPNADGDAVIWAGAALTMPNLADLFELRFRVGAEIPTADGQFPLLTTNIMPVVPLGPGSVMFDVGMTMRLHEDFDSTPHLGWWIGPVYRLPMASGSLQAGIHIRSGVNQLGGNQSSLTNSDDVLFNIPIALTFSF